ncbi:hypothetical protein DAI22_08g241800 [Oryza sativa Japonica Group]|nr:hypothetical protein DAI22_08g241800 [Oryza sativa Japonica Group]
MHHAKGRNWRDGHESRGGGGRGDDASPRNRQVAFASCSAWLHPRATVVCCIAMSHLLGVGLSSELVTKVKTPFIPQGTK